MTVLSWLAADLRTGRVLEDFPDLDADYPLRRTIGQYETATAHLPLPTVQDKDWRRATLPLGSFLACYASDDPGRNIVWSGIVTQRVRNTTTDIIDLSLATPERYLARRKITDDKTFSNTGQNKIVQELVDAFVADSALHPGIQITTVFEPSHTEGTERDRTYLGSDDAWVYDRIQQLAGVQGGPEWTIETVWSDDEEHLLFELHVGSRLGTAAKTGMAPNVTFSMPGSLVDVVFTEDYSDGKGANRIVAKSTAQGSNHPLSAAAIPDDLGGRPTVDYTWTPSTSITNLSTLRSWAFQAEATLVPGAQTITLTAALAALQQGRRLGHDWVIGDDIGFVIGGTRTRKKGAGGGSSVDDNPTMKSVDNVVDAGTAAGSSGTVYDGGDAAGTTGGVFDGGDAAGTGDSEFVHTGPAADGNVSDGLVFDGGDAAGTSGTVDYETVLAFPGGYSGTGRVVGYLLSAETVVPVLADKTVYTAPEA